MGSIVSLQALVHPDQLSVIEQVDNQKSARRNLLCFIGCQTYAAQDR
ncbi:hypothetical protein [Roseinatronobacter monicus]|nr:hypothetical protein [Roseinatronobacter monicus]